MVLFVNRTSLTAFIFCICFLFSHAASAAHQIVNLTVDYKTVHFTGKTAKAIAVNQQIPGPTLHFKEGDEITINVYNHLKVGTTIHWHGLLVPWQMDGVAGVSQTPIPPGGVFHYKFTLHQSGTYWYHAHEEFQEQQGLYGAIIIDPSTPPPYHYNKDYVVVLSDWNNAAPEKVYARLKKTGDYYTPRFPLQPSLKKFLHDYRKATPEEKKKLLADYQMMQQMRMSLYDLSDVAYDAYLLNGQTRKNPWTAPVKMGDVVRLRFIDAGGSTIFNVKIPETPMNIVHVDGNNVRPMMVNQFSIAPGETYDVLISIKKPRPYFIYAESIDTLDHALGALTTSPHQFLNTSSIKPFPKPLPVTREMMNNMMSTSMKHDSSPHHSMNMKMKMPTESTLVGDKILNPSAVPETLTTPSIKYEPLVAAVKTNDPTKPIKGVINMELFGYMNSYIWFINGIPGYKAKPIVLEPAQRYRLIFRNTSMMNHPMHIHGHWFILRNGHGTYDPLLHTINVPPGATIVADIDTDASGQWFFHCHQLYHMMAGMNRVFQYSTLVDLAKGKSPLENIIKPLPYTNQAIVRVDEAPIPTHLVSHPSGHPSRFFMASFLDVDADPFNNSQEVTYNGLFGRDYNKLQLYMNEAEVNKGVISNADLDIFYWHLFRQFWAIKGGANYVYRPAKTPYLQPGLGIEGLMPYSINTNLRTYYRRGSVKADLELFRDTLLSYNFFFRTGIRGIFATKTISQDEIGKGMNEFELTARPYYQINSALALYLQYQNTSFYGETHHLLHQNNEPTHENRYSVGLSLLF